MNVACPAGYTCKIEPYDAVALHLFIAGFVVIVLAVIAAFVLIELRDHRR